ncbi:MAG: hypothetical protein SGCHY_005158, partial [Lobulomycetales sp.]
MLAIVATLLSVASAQTMYGVAYAPLRYSTLECPSEQNVREDISAIAGVARTVRLYQQGCNTTLSAIRACAENNLLLYVGVHVDENASTYTEQMEFLMADLRAADPLQVARVLRGVVVGNEAIFRDEITSDGLVDLVGRTRTSLAEVIPGGIPVSASDVFIIYLRNQNLIDAVDFMVPNIHIFFNRRAPFDIDTQFNKFWENYESLQALSPGKEILVGEFGWPSAGIPKDDNPNNLPCPGKAERVLARFVCETAARSPPVGYFYFSAFDAYWKPDSH